MEISEILGVSAPWTEIDAAALRQFLSTVSGKRYLGQMFRRRPIPTERSDAFKRGVQSGVTEGFEEFFKLSLELTTPKLVDKGAPAPDRVT